MKFLSQSESQTIDTNLLKLGFELSSLIEIAGFAAFEAISSLILGPNILVVIGPGNNGADGLVIARWLHLTNYNVTILLHKTNNPKLLNICIGINVINDIDPNKVYDCVIDAVFGFSFKPRPIDSPYSKFIDYMAKHENVISVDVPSGHEIDKINNSNRFRPRFVVCLVGPKICCEGFKIIVARAFYPKEIFYDPEYTNYNGFKKLYK